MWGGFGMALRRWPTAIVFAGMIAVATTVLSFALVDVLAQVAVLRGAKELRERHAVVFAPYYPYGMESSVDDHTVKFLMDLIDRQEAYTAVVYNMGLDDPNFAGGHPTLVLFGDIISKLFPDLKICDPAPCAARGAKLAGQEIDSVIIAGERIPVVNTLPPGTTFFDPGVAGLPLDNRIVIRAPTKLLPLLHPIEREEALVRAVLLGPSEEDVDAYVSGCAEGGLFLVPQDVAVDQPQKFRQIMMTSAMYIIGMLGFLALVFAAFMSSARVRFLEERRAFRIRQMYGATPLHIMLRIGGFLAAVLLVPQEILLFLMWMFFQVAGVPAPEAALWVMLALVFVFIFLWISSVREVLSREEIGWWA
ncbi:hypothetical protein AB1399_02735 [Hydrogenibacillus schlegelii]|uniref:hypothetical protein n=1 Tax=Hydrogenibacillus schlegelii TaxID=1484 RepID=UPI001FE1224F|nr:hypothetical protein [Hydrogenibacillus schlegelii]